jgi:hypothetical protein
LGQRGQRREREEGEGGWMAQAGHGWWITLVIVTVRCSGD